MPSRGSQGPNWQRYIPKQVVLAQIVAGSTGAKKTCTFRVPFPDSRLRVKTSIMWVQNDPLDPAVNGANLWMYEVDDLETPGVLGQNDLPLTNIVGTLAAPLVIPVAAGLLGYTREFVSAADYIDGQLQVTGDGRLGYWVLQCRYQPYSVSFSAEEWNSIIAQCNPTAGKVTVG